MSEQLYTA